jgi:hypothetical protein
MGHRGLLLNDPYKIDRIDGCVCLIWFCLIYVRFYLYDFSWAIRTRRVNRGIEP